MKEWLNPFSSFRARIVFFVLLVPAVTILVLSLINRHSEQRITRLVANHNRDTSLNQTTKHLDRIDRIVQDERSGKSYCH